MDAAPSFHDLNARALARQESDDLRKNPGCRRMKLIAGLLMTAALAVASGCARTDWIDRTLVTVDVTGDWVIWPDNNLWLELKQEGTKVTGSYRWTGWWASEDRGGPLEGTLNGDTFQFKQVLGASLEAEMVVNGDEMSGRLRTKYGPALRSFRRMSSPSQPGQPTR